MIIITITYSENIQNILNNTSDLVVKLKYSADWYLCSGEEIQEMILPCKLRKEEKSAVPFILYEHILVQYHHIYDWVPAPSLPNL